MIVASDVLEDLMLLDDLDIAVILALGPEKLNHLKIQKIAFLISKFLRLESDATPYAYGPFSETIMEKLVTGYLSDYIARDTKGYRLSERGLRVYEALVKILMEKGRENELKAIDALRKLPEDKLLLLIYHLFPDFAQESKIVENIERLRKKAVQKSLRLFKVERSKDDSMVLEIDA